MTAEQQDAPSDPRLDAAQLAKARADARKAAADARKAEIDVLVPDFPTDLPSGTLDVPDSASPLGALAAHRALTTPANEIAEAVLAAGVHSLRIVADDSWRRAREAHETVKAQLARFSDLLSSAEKELRVDAPQDRDRAHRPMSSEPEPEPRSLTAAAAVQIGLAAAPAVLSLFQTDRSVRNGSVSLSYHAAAAAVIAELLGRGFDSTSLIVAGVSATWDPEIHAEILGLEKRRDAVSLSVSQRKVAADAEDPDVAKATARLASYRTVLDATLKSAVADLDPLTVLSRIDEAAESVARHRDRLARESQMLDTVTQILDAVDELLVQLRTPDPTGATPLSLAAAHTAGLDSHVLVLQPSFAGSESLYEDVKFGKDKALHLGSVVVTWFLLSADGTIVRSGVSDGYRAAATKLGETRVDWGRERQNG